MSRTGIVARAIAVELMAMRQGERLPPVQDLAGKSGVGNGTVGAALDVLKDAGALRLRARGRLGTFIEEIDYSLLWELSGGRSLSIALPLPYTRRYEGLATGLQQVFRDASLPLTLMFIRGASERAEAVRSGRADMAIVSGFAAQRLRDLPVVHDFGERTFVGGHGLVIAASKHPADPDLRVAVDATSIDQVELTRQYFRNLPDEQFVDVPYNQLPALIEAGVIDAAIWNLDDLRNRPRSGVQIVDVPELSHGITTSAVVIAKPEGRGRTVAARDVLASEDLLAAAHAVVEGTRIPTY